MAEAGRCTKLTKLRDKHDLIGDVRGSVHSWPWISSQPQKPPPLVVEEVELDEMLMPLDGAIGELETAYARSLK